MKKCLFWLLLLGITCFSPLQASERTRDLPEKVVLQLRWLHQPQFVGYHMAKAKGYYADAGLDVEIRPGGMGISPVQEVLAGRADFGVGNTEVLTTTPRASRCWHWPASTSTLPPSSWHAATAAFSPLRTCVANGS